MTRLIFALVVLSVGACSLFLPAALAQHEHPAVDTARLGKVTFPVSCAPSTQQAIHQRGGDASFFLVRESPRYFRWCSRERPDVRHGVLGNHHDLLPSHLATAQLR